MYYHTILPEVAFNPIFPNKAPDWRSRFTLSTYVRQITRPFDNKEKITYYKLPCGSVCQKNTLMHLSVRNWVTVVCNFELFAGNTPLSFRPCNVLPRSLYFLCECGMKRPSCFKMRLLLTGYLFFL